MRIISVSHSQFWRDARKCLQNCTFWTCVNEDIPEHQSTWTCAQKCEKWPIFNKHWPNILHILTKIYFIQDWDNLFSLDAWTEMYDWNSFPVAFVLSFTMILQIILFYYFIFFSIKGDRGSLKQCVIWAIDNYSHFIGFCETDTCPDILHLLQFYFCHLGRKCEKSLIFRHFNKLLSLLFLQWQFYFCIWKT